MPIRSFDCPEELAKKADDKARDELSNFSVVCRQALTMLLEKPKQQTKNKTKKEEGEYERKTS